jgi:tetratricopeptide (TPR) repeat protein
MVDTSRIDDLRRRIERDPASIAFAQLAEEYRRAGLFAEAVDTCRAGLVIHPSYLSARVTLGRALAGLGRIDEARAELAHVLEIAPDHLAATRDLAEVYRQAGDTEQARRHFEAALRLAPHDPDIERALRQLGDAAAPDRRERTDSSRQRAVATIAALERWLEALHATRTDRRA